LVEDEDYCKETLESTRLEVVENITKYQQETKKWRPQGSAKRHTGWGPGSHEERRSPKHREIATQVGRTIHNNASGKARILLPQRP